MGWGLFERQLNLQQVSSFRERGAAWQCWSWSRRSCRRQQTSCWRRWVMGEPSRRHKGSVQWAAELCTFQKSLALPSCCSGIRSPIHVFFQRLNKSNSLSLSLVTVSSKSWSSWLLSPEFTQKMYLQHVLQVTRLSFYWKKYKVFTVASEIPTGLGLAP